jgi:hypothetical protein
MEEDSGANILLFGGVGEGPFSAIPDRDVDMNPDVS